MASLCADNTGTIMAGRYILMGDIVRSSTYDARKLWREFMQLISSCNRKIEGEILSPSIYGDDSANIDIVTENTFLWDIYHKIVKPPFSIPKTYV